MYKDAINTQDAYAINQYNACCRYLDIPVSFDVEGKTLLEKIVLLTEQRDRLENILKKCLSEMPVGYIPNHTIETLPTMIQEQSQMLAEETTCSEKLQEQRDKYRDIASELIAMIRINVMRDTFKTATTEQVNEYLKQWIERIADVKGGSDE